MFELAWPNAEMVNVCVATVLVNNIQQNGLSQTAVWYHLEGKTGGLA
jgi:hypothetical protein